MRSSAVEQRPRSQLLLLVRELVELRACVLVVRQISTRSERVDLGQLEQLFDAFLSQEAFQGRAAHLACRAVAQVLVDQKSDTLGLDVAHAQTAANCVGHLRAHVCMAVERRTPVRPDARGAGFATSWSNAPHASVFEQPPAVLQAAKRVLPDVALRWKSGVCSQPFIAPSSGSTCASNPSLSSRSKPARRVLP
jgi:hypothetical protein